MSSPLFIPLSQRPSVRYLISGLIFLGGSYLPYWSLREWPPGDDLDGWQNLFFVACTFAFAVHVAFLSIEEVIYTFQRQRRLLSGRDEAPVAPAQEAAPETAPRAAMAGNLIDRRIPEDFKIYWPVIYIVGGIVVAMLVAITLMSHEVRMPRVVAGVVICLGIFTWVCLRLGLRDRLVAGRYWRLTNEGLRRVYPSGRAELIRWEQIGRMRWVRFKGLTFRWAESKPAHEGRCAEFRAEWPGDWLSRAFRGRLLLQQAEARDVMALAEERRKVDRG